MSVDQLLRGRPAAPAAVLRSGRVTKVTADGSVYVTPDGGSEAAPIGPCSGAQHNPPVPTTGGGHVHQLQPIPRGSRVLLAITPTGPWVVSWEESS